MYEAFYGFSEKPFSITPDPKFFYQSDSHRGALELLRLGLRNKDGFMVITGDIGTGKTTLCRALLEGLDSKVSTALILNPFLSEDDLLKVILQDFGIVSRENRREMSGASKQDLIELLNQFLLNTLAIGGSALLIIDEAQNLPLPTLEQIRILSNLETNKEKLLQIILVGQLGLADVLKSEQLRQLDQRIASRYQIGPLTTPEIPRYINHRLLVAGSRGNIHFDVPAVQWIYHHSRGFPRLINLLCDRALMSGFAAQSHTITREMVKKAAETLDLPGATPSYAYKLRGESVWSRYRRAFVTSLALTVGLLLVVALWPRIHSVVEAFWPSPKPASPAFKQVSAVDPIPVTVTPSPEADAAASTPESELAKPTTKLPTERSVADTARSSQLPAVPTIGKAFSPDSHYPYTILLGSFQAVDPLRTAMNKLEGMGYKTYVASVDLGPKGTWHRLLVGRFRNARDAGKMADEIKDYGEFPYVKVIASERVLR